MWGEDKGRAIRVTPRPLPETKGLWLGWRPDGQGPGRPVEQLISRVRVNPGFCFLRALRGIEGCTVS